VEERSDKCNVSNTRSIDSAFATHRDIGAYLHRKNNSIDKIGSDLEQWARESYMDMKGFIRE
jgi:hypothetical protein